MTKQHDVHVVAEPERHSWKVTQGRRTCPPKPRRRRTLSHHRTQGGAVNAARREARRDRVDLVTNGRNGRIRSKDSYGNEGPTRDTEH
jgi:hypothetical protein